MTENMQNPCMMSWLSPGLHPWWIVLLFGILLVALGVVFFMTPVVTTLVLITFLGAYWFVSGLFSLVSEQLNSYT
ncbi:MAG: hypothetical protein STSR0009_31540 [Methanoregula sp.]